MYKFCWLTLFSMIFMNACEAQVSVPQKVRPSEFAVEVTRKTLEGEDGKKAHTFTLQNTTTEAYLVRLTAYVWTLKKDAEIDKTKNPVWFGVLSPREKKTITYDRLSEGSTLRKVIVEQEPQYYTRE